MSVRRYSASIYIRVYLSIYADMDKSHVSSGVSQWAHLTELSSNSSTFSINFMHRRTHIHMYVNTYKYMHITVLNAHVVVVSVMVLTKICHVLCGKKLSDFNKNCTHSNAHSNTHTHTNTHFYN